MRALIQCDDWNEAGHRYAELHDEGYEHTHRADRWLTDLFLDTGAQAESRRARALPKILEDSTRLIDTGAQRTARPLPTRRPIDVCSVKTPKRVGRILLPASGPKPSATQPTCTPIFGRVR